MSLASLNTAELEVDALEPIVGAIEELVADVGVHAVIAAVMRSSCADKMQNGLTRLGGDASVAVIQFVLRQIIDARDSKMEAEIMAMAVGLILKEDMTVTRLARRYGCTKQAVSKRIVTFCERNGLPPSIYMRPERDRETYRLFNKPRIS